MYKGNSASLQRYHKVHEIAVERTVEADFIPSAANMNMREVEDEISTLQREITRVEQELAIAKRERDFNRTKFLGSQKAGLQARVSTMRLRRSQLSRDNSAQALGQAVKEVLPDEWKERVYARQREIEEKAREAAILAGAA